MPEYPIGITSAYEYSDEQAQLVKRVAALEQSLADTKLVLSDAVNTLGLAVKALDALTAAVQRMAEYQGVKHLLSPQ